MSHFSTFLFARPSFFEGAGRIVDFGNTLSSYNVSVNGPEADRRAIYADWSAISEDIRQVVERHLRVAKAEQE